MVRSGYDPFPPTSKPATEASAWWERQTPRTWAVIAASVVAVLALSWLIGQLIAGPSTPGTPTGNPAAPTASPAGPPSSQGAVGIGADADDKSLTFTIREVRTGQKSVPGAAAAPPAKGQFVVVYITVQNPTTKAKKLTAKLQLLYDGMGATYRPDASATKAAAGELSNTPVPAGKEISGVLVYDIPAAAVPTKLEFHSANRSPGVAVAL